MRRTQGAGLALCQPAIHPANADVNLPVDSASHASGHLLPLTDSSFRVAWHARLRNQVEARCSELAAYVALQIVAPADDIEQHGGSFLITCFGRCIVFDQRLPARSCQRRFQFQNWGL